jgi:hypothetical protein
MSAGVELLPAPASIALNNIEAVRREASRVYRAMRSGQMATSDGTKLIYVLSEIVKMHAAGQIENRLNAIEQELYES